MVKTGFIATGRRSFNKTELNFAYTHAHAYTCSWGFAAGCRVRGSVDRKSLRGDTEGKGILAKLA